MRRTRLAVLTAAFGVAVALVAATFSWAAPSSGSVVMLDACDPATFNAAIGEGTCERPGGGVTIDSFVEQLLTHGAAPSWRFSGPATVAAGGTLTAVNRGGEFHTFTKVAAFGGGCVAALNVLLGLTPVPECAQAPGIFGSTGAPMGGSTTTAPLAAGTHLFICLIHPWMKSTVIAK
jgi:plastocyanin